MKKDYAYTACRGCLRVAGGRGNDVHSHAISDGYTLLRSRSKSAARVRSRKSDWFVLMLVGTRTDGYTSQMSCESVEAQHEVASVHLQWQSQGKQYAMMMTMTILLIAAIVILWQFSSGLWML